MDPAIVAQLRTWALDAIAQGLESVATNWSKLNVDGLCLRKKTLASLQMEYRELWEGLPDCSAEDIERLLRRYARGIRLDDQRVTVSHSHFLEARLRLTRSNRTSAASFRIKPADDTWEWLQPVFRGAGSLVRSFTIPSALYVVSHRSLGALYPIITEAFRDELCEIKVQETLINPSGHVRLLPLIAAHSRWLAHARAEATPALGDDSVTLDLATHEGDDADFWS